MKSTTTTTTTTPMKGSIVAGGLVLLLSTWACISVLQGIWKPSSPSLNHFLTTDSSTPQRRRLTEAEQTTNEEFMKTTAALHLPMFQVSEFTVLGPTAFPKPSDKAIHVIPGAVGGGDGGGEGTIVNHLSPTSGQHRHDQDAILLFAAEYSLSTYVLFLSTLRDTGYEGDVVLAISNLDWRDKSVHAFLEQDPHVIVYVVEFACFNAEGEQVDSVKGGMRVCQCHNLYGYQTTDGKITPLPDPRPPRTVPTTRYELYWIWAEHYDKHSWIMLIDARDTVFQTNPFANVPRETDPDRGDGRLYFFGENIEATRIGKSKQNRKWLTNAYGQMVVQALQDKPTICSGSTMGEQVALETYLRAMVNESDETGTKLMGADQGFHNYLYYSNKLANAKAIRSITVQDQGNAIINNLGAMRIKELSEWGNGKILTMDEDGKVPRVLNWDGETSPVIHQFDRHKLLSEYWYKDKGEQYRRQWLAKQNK